ncbi:MAG: S8 family serine peptidase [Bacteroidales bacterium]|nr:S8 family serine peptidase [Bacteroidales bacterium]MDD4604623.1 S8 family serine peptidase [Bacteroidales bacterium]
MKHSIFLSALLFLSCVCFAQIAPNKYFVAFTDKNGTPYTLDNPEAFLTQRAIDRRNNQGIPIVENDLPVNPNYIAQVKNMGVTILNPTKWLNGITLIASDTSVMASIRALPFVSKVYKCIANEPKTPVNSDKFKIEESYASSPARVPEKTSDAIPGFNYGDSYRQISMVLGTFLHDLGYRGQGKVIAILDAGFLNADFLPVFDSLRVNGQILGTRDFVLPGNNVYNEYQHGMEVLSIMGGNYPGLLIGTAPKADYWLLRSEDAATENIIEEYNWVSAAEFADSVGADVINSSLGYTTFDDPKYDHTCADMDGHSAPATRGANFAASKGIAVICSAGNEGGTSWTCMSAPADGDLVLAIAAVDSLGHRANFSSVGVNTAGRVKPNIAAMGESTVVAYPDGNIGRGSGTSFSSPVIAGVVACLWQSRSNATVLMLYDAIQESASQYNTPDSLLGYGIPDFSNAFTILSTGEIQQVTSAVFPNPFTNRINVRLNVKSNPEINLKLYDRIGRIVASKTFLGSPGANTTYLDNLSGLTSGLYLLKVSGNNFTEVIKVVKQ